MEIFDLDGNSIDIDSNNIKLVVGPYPADVGPHTYIYGATPRVLVTSEEAISIVERINAEPPFCVLTRPNGTAAWIRRTAVDSVREPVWTEIPPNGGVGAIIMIGSFHQAVRESVSKVREIIGWTG